MLAQINDIQMAFSDTGEGTPTVLLVHGYPFNRATWDPQLGPLRDQGARVIVPDLRGFGASEAGAGGPLTMERHADDLAALLDHLGVREPVVFGGLSMGGYIAFAFWRRHAERARAFVLADTKASADTPEARENRLKLARAAEQDGSAEPIVQAMLPRMFSPAVPPEHALARQLRAIMAGTSGPSAAAGMRGLADRPDSLDLLPGIRVPTLVLVGDQDAITPVADAERLAAGVPGAQLTVIPGAGHVSNMEQPEAFNAALLGFLQRL